jgi:hypothetical protein
MKTANFLRALAVGALLASACGTPATGHVTSGSRTTPTSTIGATPLTNPCTPSNRCLALVSLRGSTQYAVRDITDIHHPTSVTTFTSPGLPSFAGPAAVSYAKGPTLLRLSWPGVPTKVAEPPRGLYFNTYAWSPDGASVAYVTPFNSGAQLRLISGGQDRIIAPIATLVPTHSCPYASCADQADIRLLFSPDGTSISFVQNYGGPSLYVWSLAGKLLLTDASESDMMSVWSGSALYFRDDAGVERWEAGVKSVLLPGVAWIRPKASSVEGQIVYEVRDPAGTSHIRILDTSSGTTREIAKSRSEPAFLGSHYLWYKGERPCVTGDSPPCGGSVKTTDSGKTYIYDLQDGTEAQSLITRVLDVWPHPA